jgi:cytoskeleton protein RodZ
MNLPWHQMNFHQIPVQVPNQPHNTLKREKIRSSPVHSIRGTGDVSLEKMAETIGKQLKRAREAKNLTIQKVVQATHIRAHYIEAIEADEFESLPSPIQARGFLRLYAEFLGHSLEESIARQRQEVVEIPAASEDINLVTGHISASAIDLGKNPIAGKKDTTVDFAKMLHEGIDQGIHRQNKLFLEPAGPEEFKGTNELKETGKLEESAPLEETPGPIIELLPSQEIFNTIGKTLKQRRESLSLTLDEIERHIHVRKHYLLALEAGDFLGLPSSVQSRGMLYNYARFLNMDVDAILLTFADGLQSQLLERQATSIEETKKSSSIFPFLKNVPFKVKIPAIVRRYISVDIIVGGGLIVMLLAFAIWGTSRIINMRTGSPPQPTAPPILNFLVLSSEPSTSTPEPATIGNEILTNVPVLGETLSVILPAAGNSPVQVVVIAQNSAFVRVTVDGKIQFDGRVTAGMAYPFDGNIQIEVLTGNGRAISILYNQNNLGPMGEFGEVVDHIYTANAILNPTATFTPTPSVTPTPTITLRPTATLRPSVTPRRNPTPRPSQTPEH